jgi:hypothetical protein
MIVAHGHVAVARDSREAAQLLGAEPRVGIPSAGEVEAPDVHQLDLCRGRWDGEGRQGHGEEG